ncbi:MAG TPA: hypothetical protein VLG91_00715 [Streptomyces sp.]|jgi:hypothetical protein|nr:hypothetical protein [Streptomyces sp.]
MTVTDPYQLTTTSTDGTDGTDGMRGTHGTSEPVLPRGEVVRALLWTLVVVGAVANSAATYAEAATWVHLACGVVTLFGVVTLAVRHLRGRR